MALLGSTDRVAGYLGAIPFKEYPGSSSFEITDTGIVATRILHVPWESLWQAVQELTPRADRKNMDVDIDAPWVFPGFPGRIDSPTNAFRSRLIVNNISVEPAWNGKTPGITTDSANHGIIKYDEAALTVSYAQDVADMRSTEWQMSISEQYNRDRFLFDNSSSDKDSDQADAKMLFPSQEFSIRLSGWKLGHADNDRIRSTQEAAYAVGKINGDEVRIWNGTLAYDFKYGQIRMEYFELSPQLRLGRLQNDIVYHFAICPAMWNSIDVEDDETPTWNHVYDPAKHMFRVPEEDIYPDGTATFPFSNLVFWNSEPRGSD
jgi:hypothetical protein